jgi:Glycosyltransferase family 87
MKLSRDRKISVLLGFITIGFAAITIFYYWRGMLMGMPFPDNTFLTSPASKFGDYFGTLSQWHAEHFSGIGYGLSYFPATYLLIEPFNLLYGIMPGEGYEAMLSSLYVFDALFCGFLFFFAYKGLKSDWAPESVARACICILMTYPALFTLTTGNFEALLFVALALFLYFYQSGHMRRSLPFLAIAIAMKLVPAVFIVLLAADKRYKEILYVGLWAAFFTLLSLLIFPGGLWDGLLPYLDRLAASQQMYFDLMVVQRSGNHFGHSLLNGVRVLLGQTGPLTTTVLRGYLVFTLASFAALSYYIVRIEQVLWKQVALLVCAMCLLPYTSTDYKLLHFFLPIFLFVNHPRPEKYDMLYAVLFGLLLIPKSYVKFYHLDFYNTNVVLNTGAMLVMVGVIVSTRLRDRSSSLRVAPSNSGSRMQTSQ